ncbi:MAG TPA: diguanylate cyclase [Paucimonas sp.]|nr:diguanylate cyclase [Paucimonas sp.]
MDTRPASLLPNFADLLLDAVFLVDAQGSIVYVSAASERIFGYQPYEMIGKAMLDFVAPEDRARTLEEAGRVMAGQPRVGFENRYLRKDGSRVNIMWSARWLEAGKMRIGVARDVTERKRAEEIQAMVYAVSEAAHDATDLPTLFADIHKIIASFMPVAGFAVTTWAPKTKQIVFSYQADRHGASTFAQEPLAIRLCTEVIRSGKPKLLPDEAADDHAPGVDAAHPEAEASWLLIPLAKRGKTIGALILKSPPGMMYCGKDKELLSFVSAQIATAMERAQLHAELLHAARYDELTGLPNRRLFHDRTKSALARCRRKQSRLAVLYVDIDDFKLVNDTLGHAGGDLLLQEFARRLEQGIREADTVARLGGDEFVVLLEDIQRYEDAVAVADKIRNAINRSMVIEGRTVDVRASIGIALYPDGGTDEDALLNRADHAMYLDKRARRRSDAA